MQNKEFPLSLAVTVVDRGQAKKVIAVYKTLGINVWMNIFGRGTATSETLQYLGLGEPEKDVQFALMPRSMTETLFSELNGRLSIEKPGHGVVFTVPLSSVAGRKTLGRICAPAANQQNTKEASMVEKREETKSASQQYEYSLIVTILNSGSAEAVMEAATKAGAGGGTVLHGRGLNAKNAEKFFGFTIQAEKDMLLIVARTAEKDTIMRAIAKAEDMTAEGRGMTFSLPVDSLAGITRMMQTEK